MNNQEKLNQELINACEIGNIKEAKKLIKQGADVNSYDGMAFFYCFCHKNYKLMKLLIKHGVYCFGVPLEEGQERYSLNNFEFLFRGLKDSDFKFIDFLIKHQKNYKSVVKEEKKLEDKDFCFSFQTENGSRFKINIYQNDNNSYYFKHSYSINYLSTGESYILQATRFLNKTK